MAKKFSLTRVYTRNIVTDTFQSIRSLFGLRLRGYESMINEGTNEIIKLAESKYKINDWRLSINPIGKDAVMITIYGEYE